VTHAPLSKHQASVSFNNFSKCMLFEVRHYANKSLPFEGHRAQARPHLNRR
jgi:hypothetical protein